MHRIFFDTNAGTKREGYILWFEKSREDIERISPEERDGALVILYMPNELELEAYLKRDEEAGFWRGIPVSRP